MELHPGEEIVFEGRPVWRSILSFYVLGLLGAIVAGVVVALAVSTAAGVLAWLALFALVILVGFLRRVSTRYAITTQRLRIQRGILSRSVQQTRIERVQNVTTRQSLAARALRVGTVDFDTAGTDGGDFAFVGVGDPARVVAAVDRAQRRAAAADPAGL
jgi:uncharacterized membrane protein YdbT with pleckstrin-like domain